METARTDWEADLALNAGSTSHLPVTLERSLTSLHLCPLFPEGVMPGCS